MNTTKTLIFASLVAALLPGAAIAQDRIKGYLLDTRGALVKNNFGQCWRTGSWTPAMAIAECDPSLVKRVEAPKPKVAAVTPPPAQVLTPPSPAPQRVAQTVSFSADALFDFDKATLKPDGMTELDGMVRDLSGVSYDAIHVTGNTDRIGSDKYNQKLSEKRANAVREYLVSKGIAENRITAEGKGEHQPVTKLSDCTGPKSKKLIACLQPDRRVDVEVSGTK